MKRGIFITFEGPDGSGKSTQIDLLKDYLAQGGSETVITREPGGTAIGEKIRKLILDPAHTEMDPTAEALLYAASRAQHTAEVILPALREGRNVICDRYMDSSIAYQGYGRNLGDSVRIINEIAVMGLIPDLTFLLMLDPEIGRSRINEQWDRLENEKLAYHKAVYEGYVTLAKENSGRIVLINANKEIDDIHREIIEKMKQRAYWGIEDQR
jgi:dTMP kinase